MARSILIIEDDQVLGGLMVAELLRMGYRATTVGRWADAQRFMADVDPDLIIMDIRLPDADGIDLLPQITARLPVLVLTAYGTVENAVRAMKGGAAEYMVKPVNIEELEVVVARVLETAAIRHEHAFLKTRMEEASHHRFAMVGGNPALVRVRELIAAVAPSDMTVLIQGESGVGKELAAYAIHEHSPRAGRNFVAVDCCTLPENLFESELFGHEKGAFTGADRQKIGLIEGAAGGTLFLDEIGEIPPAGQAKLLRVLETGRFRRVGGTRDIAANVRIVAATNRDLEQASRDGSFRADLFYRLNAFVVTVPPLRERRQDIPALVNVFIRNHNFSRRIDKGVSRVALDRLVAYDWPGNVRELKNVVERAIILSGDRPTIDVEHLAIDGGGLATIPAAGTALTFDREPTLEEVKKAYLSQLLARYDGHRARVAKALGISERNTYRLIKKFGLDG
jgi:DNA-binding NtrC family response regulator